MNINLPSSPEQLPPLVLAYVGDAVYELYTRLHLVSKGVTRMHELHHEAVACVRASTQAQLVRHLAEMLSEEEREVLRRGRNAKPGHVPRNADMVEYRYSTGLETLIGYLYLKGERERLDHIFSMLFRLLEQNGDERG